MLPDIARPIAWDAVNRTEQALGLGYIVLSDIRSASRLSKNPRGAATWIQCRAGMSAMADPNPDPSVTLCRTASAAELGRWSERCPNQHSP